MHLDVFLLSAGLSSLRVHLPSELREQAPSRPVALILNKGFGKLIIAQGQRRLLRLPLGQAGPLLQLYLVQQGESILVGFRVPDNLWHCLLGAFFHLPQTFQQSPGPLRVQKRIELLVVEIVEEDLALDICHVQEVASDLHAARNVHNYRFLARVVMLLLQLLFLSPQVGDRSFP